MTNTVTHIHADMITIPPKPGKPAVFMTAASVTDTVHLHRVAEILEGDARHSASSAQDREALVWMGDYMDARADGDITRCRRLLRWMRSVGA